MSSVSVVAAVLTVFSNWELTRGPELPPPKKMKGAPW